MLHRLIEYFTRNHVAANLMLALIAVGGLMTTRTIVQEVFPEFSVDMITVTTVYPGAAPEEVERGVCIPIEEEVEGIDGVKRISSVSSEGACMVTIELATGANNRQALDDVKSAVDAVDTLPAEAERPLVAEVRNRRQVINVAVAGGDDERTLKVIAEQVRDEIAALPGITQAFLTAVRPYEIGIEVSEEGLRRYGLTFDEVAAAVRGASLDLPGGSVRTADGEILVRGKGQADRGSQFAALPLRSLPGGATLTVGDVATVVDGFADVDLTSRFDGKRAALVQVYRVGEQRAIDMADRIHAYLAHRNATLPPGISLTAWEDSTVVLKSRMDLLLRNGASGLLLVFAVLALFLEIRLAGWVMFGIPASFLGAIWLMPPLDVTVNMISLFAFIIVLGLVVDDAIVIGESIHTHQGNEGGPSVETSVAGAREVAVPVIFGVLTTVAAFAPMLSVPGTMGKVMRVVPLIVIPVLLFSLLESQLVLPSHLAHMRRRGQEAGRWSRFQERFSGGLLRFIDRRYRPQLEWSLTHRGTVAAGFVALLLVTTGLVRGGYVRFDFMPAIEADNVVAMLVMPQGTAVEETARNVEALRRAAERVRERFEGKQEGGLYRHVLATVGDQPFRSRQQGHLGGIGGGGGQLGEVNVQLAPSEERSVTSDAVARAWREEIGGIPGAEELTFFSSLFPPGRRSTSS